MSDVETTIDACGNCGADGEHLSCICGVDVDARRVAKVLAAFDAAASMKSYAAAKRLCCKLFRNPHRQLAFVDAARAAYARINSSSPDVGACAA